MKYAPLLRRSNTCPSLFGCGGSGLLIFLLSTPAIAAPASDLLAEEPKAPVSGIAPGADAPRAEFPGSGKELQPLLATLRAVDREGRGNVEASRAWSRLSAHDGSAIPEILAAMEGANPLASNWLEAAFDAIVEREERGGRPPPIAALEGFVLDFGRAARPRRLAYETLLRADPGRSEEILSKLERDPTSAFRREVIDRRIVRASALEAEGRKDEALRELEGALEAARDKDQVGRLAGLLEKAGKKVDLARYLGFVRSWTILGPFPSEGPTGFSTSYPPEAGPPAKGEEPALSGMPDGKGATLEWRRHSVEDPWGVVDLNRILGRYKNSVAYALTEVTGETEADVEVRLGSVTAWKLWWNGSFVFGHEEYHHGMEADQFRVPVRLEKGRNWLLFKVCQNDQKEDFAQEWMFQLRLTDESGAAISKELRS